MLPAAAAVLRQPPIPNPLAAPPRPLRSHCRRAESLLPDGIKRFLGGTTTAPSPRSPAGSRFVVNGILPVDPWAPGGGIDSQSIASQLFAFSLFPYLGFLYFITRSKSAPKLTLFGFYFLLVFVGATIPAGIYAKLKYGTSLSNVDWLHGGAESLLTLTNMFIVLGLREALRKKEAKKKAAEVVPELKEKNRSSA